MSVVRQNQLLNRARDCMVKPYDQRHVRDDEPVFVQQLDAIEVKDEDDILEAIKRGMMNENGYYAKRMKILSVTTWVTKACQLRPKGPH